MHGLNYAAEHHPEHFDHMVAPFLLATLDNDGSIIQAYQRLANSTDAKDKELAQKIASLYNGIKEVAAKTPKQTQDPMAKEREKIDQEKQQLRNQSINTQAVPYLDRGIESSLTEAAKSAGFDLAKLKGEQSNRYQRFVKDVRAQIHQAVLNDDKWLDRYSRTLATGNVEKCVRMLNARHDLALKGNEHEPSVVTRIFTEWFGPPKAARQQNANGGDKGRQAARAAGQANAGGIVQVNAMPPRTEIDWSNPKTKIIDQIAMRKDGKLVTWAK